MKKALNWLAKRSLRTKVILAVILVGLGFFVIKKITGAKSTQPQYQTSEAQKGTLVVSVTASGQVTTANSVSVSTQASGVIEKVLVTNGQAVKAGAPLAKIDLDLEGKQRTTQAWASYQGVKNSLENAKISYYSLQSDLMTTWDNFKDLAESSTYQNSDGSPRNDQRQLPAFISTNNDWLSAEAKYKNQQNVVNQFQTSLSSSYMSYQQSSPTIYAPIAGVVNGMSLQEGSVLTAQSNSSGGASSQKIASIITAAKPMITVNLSEIDVNKVKIGNKATVTIDSISGKTFTGKVISVDSVGGSSSGVTTYPAVIIFDEDVSGVLTNMSASASIITDLKDDVLLVPASAIQTANGESSVRVMKDGKVEQVVVEVGLASDTQIEITSGLSEGEMVVTSVTTSTSGQQSGSTQSPFGSFGGAFRGTGGGAVRISR